jgi:hypothetical protein
VLGGGGAGYGDPYRLPRNVTPTRYTLRLEPDLAAATFAGEVDIEVVVHEASDRIMLNALDLDILSVTIDDRAVGYELDEKTERLVIDATVGPGSLRLLVAFTGTLNDMLKGWYRSTVPRRVRRRAGDRRVADAADRLPACVPVLGRARLQGGASTSRSWSSRT